MLETAGQGAHPQLRREFAEVRGELTPAWEALLERDPAYFEAYVRFVQTPWRKGAIEPKAKELIMLAVYSATTHAFEPGIRLHLHNARQHGATADEILEVLELVSPIGSHTCIEGVPILLEELAARGGGDVMSRPMTARESAIKDEFLRVRGYWSEIWEGVLRLDPDYFEAYTAFSGAPWKDGVLSPKLRELIYVAIDAATTHLYLPGLRLHIRNALGLGATGAEVMEVFALISGIGIDSIVAGMPALLEELGEPA